MTDLNNTLGGTAGFGENSIGRNDDGSFLLDITSVFENGINFYGTNYTSFYINTNGNITFGSAQSTYTPTGIAGVTRPMIAPFFADVDTRGGATTASPGGTSTGSNLIWYDLDTVNDVITITWDDVGYYNRKTNKVNAFQMELIDLGGGDWTVRFIYENIDWTTGDASGGSNGLGGTVATAGFTSGNGVDYYQLPTSGDQSAMLNLDVNDGNQGEQAVWEFLSESGSVFDLAISADTVNEFAADGTVVGTLSSVAVGPSATFSLVDDAGGRFVIVGNQLRVADGVLLDYEQRLREILTIQVFDGSNSATFDLEINIANVEPEVITAGDAGYTIVGGALNDNITTGSGNDTLNGGAGSDLLSTGAGNDVLNGGTGADTLTGGAGDDTYYVDNADDTVVELASDAGTDLVFSTVSFSVSGANQSGIEDITLTGTANIDATGNALDNTLTGNSGNNVLNGGAGNDQLIGGSGSDTLIGGLGDDILTGGAGADIFVLDLFDGSTDQYDTITDFSIADGDRIQLGPQGPASWEMLEYYLLVSDDDGNAFLGGWWNGYAQDLYLIGIDATDLTADQFIFDTSATPRVVTGTDNDEIIFGGMGNDTLTGGGNVDWLIGDAGNDVLDGGDGDDELNGGTGNDTLLGGSGKDFLIGGDGDDILNGGAGPDKLWGGAGADTFAFDAGFGRDTIFDFNAAEDKLDLQAFGVDTTAEVMPYAYNSGSSVILNFGAGNMIIISNMQVNQINDGMFV